MPSRIETLLEANKQSEPIYVVRPTLPPLEKYQQHIESIWKRRWLTNDGPCHQEFESKLCRYLDVEHLSIVSSCTMGLLLMLHSLRITSGEVITTPFTFPATTHVLHWNGAQPVFCDIDRQTGNIDPNRLESLITPKTRAILGVHVYGHPCDVNAIQSIADRHGLLVLYDAAHAFGVRFDEKSICSFGDMSALSFHATKLFSTCEGGAIICSSAAQKERLNFLKNFGIADEETVIGPGINGKMNELCAAYGLLQFDMVEEEIAKRARVFEVYDRLLAGVPGIAKLGSSAATAKRTTPNNAYYAIRITPEYGATRDEVHTLLKACNILTRKYFYPIASSYPCYASLPSASPAELPVAEEVSRQVLCLPMYGSLPLDVATTIGTLLREIPAAKRAS